VRLIQGSWDTTEFNPTRAECVSDQPILRRRPPCRTNPDRAVKPEPGSSACDTNPFSARAERTQSISWIDSLKDEN
jgi:hypothetical protein